MFKNVSRGMFKRHVKDSASFGENMERSQFSQETSGFSNRPYVKSVLKSQQDLPRIPQIISIGGGKGGIGKSFLSANLSVSLAEAGYKVALVDLDLGASNLHTCLGVQNPKIGIFDYINDKVENFSDLGVGCGVNGLTLYGGGQEFWQQVRPQISHKMKLVTAFQNLDADYVLLDLGAGTHTNTLDFFIFSHAGLLVVLPEPTSIENAYVFLKSVLFRKLQSVIKAFDQETAASSLMQRLSDPHVTEPPFSQLLAFAQENPAVGEKIIEVIKSSKIGIVMNQVRTAADSNLGNSMTQICNRYFGFSADYIGATFFDDIVWKSVRSRRPIILEHPTSNISQNIHGISKHLSDKFLPSLRNENLRQGR